MSDPRGKSPGLWHNSAAFVCAPLSDSASCAGETALRTLSQTHNPEPTALVCQLASAGEVSLRLSTQRPCACPVLCYCVLHCSVSARIKRSSSMASAGVHCTAWCDQSAVRNYDLLSRDSRRTHLSVPFVRIHRHTALLLDGKKTSLRPSRIRTTSILFIKAYQSSHQSTVDSSRQIMATTSDNSYMNDVR